MHFFNVWNNKCLFQTYSYGLNNCKFLDLNNWPHCGGLNIRVMRAIRKTWRQMVPRFIRFRLDAIRSFPRRRRRSKWSDEMRKVAGNNCMTKVLNRKQRKIFGKVYTQQWIEDCWTRIFDRNNLCNIYFLNNNSHNSKMSDSFNYPIKEQ